MLPTSCPLPLPCAARTVLALIVIFLASAMFFCEAGEWDEGLKNFMRPNALGTGLEVTPFQSIPHAMWFALASMVSYRTMYDRPVVLACHSSVFLPPPAPARPLSGTVTSSPQRAAARRSAQSSYSVESW